MARLVFWRYQAVLLLAVISLALLGLSWGNIPALGPLLSPFSGIWRNLPQEKPEREILKHEALLAPVEVVWDAYGVPHIFAESLQDLYWAQGFVVARDRLFQMDLHSRPAAGTLSEIAGPVTYETDLFFIKIGLRQASETVLKEMMSNHETRMAIEAYTEGVNFYIRSLKRNDWPPEYKIIGARPELWSPLRTANFLKTMAYNLAGRSYDLFLTSYLQKMQRHEVEFLFREGGKKQDYVFSPEAFSIKAKPLPVPPQFKSFVSKIKGRPYYPQPHANNGSNNFAIGKNKSTTGYPILANDTHLGLSLPPIWYELQLVAGDVNVYGATFPGSPGVILGFNKDLSWGVTNGTSDVIDWYEVEFKSPDSLEYLVDGKWKTAERFVELLRIKGGGVEEVEVLRTDFGYVTLREGSLGLAMKWTIHEPSNELRTFLDLNKAANVSDCRDAIRHFRTPSQNFLCADKDEISLKHQGLFPRRFAQQGRYVLDSRSPENWWQGWISDEDLPQRRGPEIPTLHSANNPIIDQSYPFYLGWEYEEPYRARRILETLSHNDKISSQDLIRLQNDIFDGHAAAVIPRMVELLDKNDLSEEQDDLLSKFEEWDYDTWFYSVAVTFYDTWWKKLEEITFENILGPREEAFYPRRHRTEDIFSWGKIFDPDAVTKSFHLAWRDLDERFGFYGTDWQWGKIRPTDLEHIAKIPGFNSGPFAFDGTLYSVKANNGSHAATWKLVVEMGPEIKAWSFIAGNNEGHPFSKKYQKDVEAWGKGEMKPVIFMRDKADKE